MNTESEAEMTAMSGIETAQNRDSAGTTAGARLTFESQGEAIAGRLFPAAFGDGPAPAVVIIGPETYQKEQAEGCQNDVPQAAAL